MVTSETNRYRDVIIKNELGLHARSAAQIAKLVKNARASVWLKKDDETVDASSIVDILTLACEKGSTLTIAIEDSADIDILNAVADLVDSGFGE
jgi:phosphocarrier protein